MKIQRSQKTLTQIEEENFCTNVSLPENLENLSFYHPKMNA